MTEGDRPPTVELWRRRRMAYPGRRRRMMKIRWVRERGREKGRLSGDCPNAVNVFSWDQNECEEGRFIKWVLFDRRMTRFSTWRNLKTARHGAENQHLSIESERTKHMGGKDTRKNFTDNLYAALVRRGFRTFRDDGKLVKGGEMWPCLSFSIKCSRISVIVLSRNYADSRWCLDELVEIMECKREFNRIVFPVFYNVDPSDVRAQRGSFAEAFAKHEDHCKGRRMEGKLEKWRAALTEAANLSGCHLQNDANGHEAVFIEMIIKDISKKLNLPYLHVADYQISIKSRVKRVNELLELGSNDVRMVGIWGIGGIGKTTIAKAIYNQIRLQFEGSSFLANIREISKQFNGLVELQEQLISDMLMDENQKLWNVDRGIELIKQRLWCRRVLVVLDDVDEIKQLNALAIRRDCFLSGSRIIVTTRDRSLLDLLNVDEVYMPELLTFNESLKLFNWHAFKKYHPMADYKEFSREVVHYAGGLPLVLVVLGSFFAGTSVLEWKNALRRLREIPLDEIQEKLRISFDSLNDYDKTLFLDLACFFVGMDKNYAIEILEAHPSSLGILTRRCLVRIDGPYLEMHDIIRDMGREIVRKEHRNPGKRSRLWFHRDVCDVLQNDTGTKAVEGLALDWHTVEEEEEVVNAQAFAKMKKLRLLKLDYVHLSGSYGYLSKRLKWLYWKGFPQESIPSELCLKEVIGIDMFNSSLKQVWEGKKILCNLKFLILSHSYYLTETLDFSQVPNLKMLFLNNCTRLVEVHETIVCLKYLVVLDLKNCKNLTKLPLDIFKLKSLQTLVLSGCSKLEEPLGLKGSSSQSWFSSFLSPLRNPSSINLPPSPSSIEGIVSMRRLILEDCNLSFVPEELGSLTSLEVLNLKGNKFCTLPASISQLFQLWDLCLRRCTNLRSLPELPVNIKWVDATYCTSLERISTGSVFQNFPSLFFYACKELVKSNFASDFTKSLLWNQERSVIGEFSISFPGDEVLDYFEYKNFGVFLYFVVPLHPNWKIQGWILSVVLSQPSWESCSMVLPALAYPLGYEVKVDKFGVSLIYNEDEKGYLYDDQAMVQYAGPSYRDVILDKDVSANQAVADNEHPPELVTRGSFTRTSIWWNWLTSETKALVNTVGFSAITADVNMRTPRAIVHCLAERWWDTTHTLYIGGRELTMTPYDFYRLSGLRMTGEPFSFDHNPNEWAEISVRLLGIAFTFTGSSIYCPRLHDAYVSYPQDTPEHRAHMARAYIMFLLGAYLVPNSLQTVSFGWLLALEDLESADRFCWGAAIYAHLISAMDSLSRGGINSMLSYWRVWVLWVHKYLWKEVEEEGAPVVSMRQHLSSRRFLDEMVVERIVPRLWEGEAPLPPVEHNTAAWELTLVSQVFEYADVRSFYLAERVAWQFAADMGPILRVPLDPPPYIPCLCSDEDLAVWRGGIVYTDRLMGEGFDYELFTREQLIPSLSLPSADPRASSFRGVDPVYPGWYVPFHETRGVPGERMIPRASSCLGYPMPESVRAPTIPEVSDLIHLVGSLKLMVTDLSLQLVVAREEAEGHGDDAEDGDDDDDCGEDSDAASDS